MAANSAAILRFSKPVPSLSWMLSWQWPGTRALYAVVCGMLVCCGVTLVQAAEVPPGAASCSGCHAARPNVETAVPRLVGQDASSMVAAMQGYRSGKRPATVMDRIARGFSDDEIKAIAAWFGTQP